MSSTAAATASTTLNTSRYWAASVATFKMASGPTHNLTVAVDPVGAGTTSPAVGINPYTEGSVVPVTIATTTSGYIFDHWSGDCSGSTCSVTMSADKSVTANFILAHTLTMAVSPSAGGTTTPTVGAHAYAVGAVVPISATAAANYHFVNWTGDADCTDGSVTLDAEKTCTANFALDQKTLTFTAGTGGTITAPAGSSPQIYDYGTVVTITAAANPGYHFTNWSGDVGTVLNVNAASTTITMNENYSITANFAVGELATLDGAVVYGTTFTGNSINLSVSTGSGQNQLMLVGVSYNSSTTGSAGSRPYISSVIFTPTVGDPITLDLVKQQWSPSTETVDPGRMAAIYILDPSKNPAAGTAGVLAVNFSASFTTGAVVGVANFKGVDQTDPLGTPNSAATGNSVATVSVDVTTTGNELVFDNFWAGGQSTTPQWTISANASQTGLWNNPLIGNTEGGASTKAASASTTTMNWTRSNNGYMALVAVPINPAPGVTMDFGDAPDPTYATLLANNGARHVIVTGYRLGATVDAEADGLPSTLADGDDLNNTDDEDGVSLPASITAGRTESLTVVTGPSGGKLDAWIDFNRDGDFDHPDELLWGSVIMTPGTSPAMYFTVPADAVAGTTYARFRLSSSGNLSPDGLASDGEVEDYRVQIIAAASLPVVTTQAVTDITQTTATGNGNVTSLGVPNPTQHGVVWSTSANPTTANSKTTDGAVSATGAFTSSITGLTAGTLYHVRAYATNTAGTAYGEDVTFTTAPGSFTRPARPTIPPASPNRTCSSPGMPAAAHPTMSSVFPLVPAATAGSMWVTSYRSRSPYRTITPPTTGRWWHAMPAVMHWPTVPPTQTTGTSPPALSRLSPPRRSRVLPKPPPPATATSLPWACPTRPSTVWSGAPRRSHHGTHNQDRGRGSELHRGLPQLHHWAECRHALSCPRRCDQCRRHGLW